MNHLTDLEPLVYKGKFQASTPRTDNFPLVHTNFLFNNDDLYKHVLSTIKQICRKKQQPLVFIIFIEAPLFYNTNIINAKFLTTEVLVKRHT